MSNLAYGKEWVLKNRVTELPSGQPFVFKSTRSNTGIVVEADDTGRLRAYTWEGEPADKSSWHEIT